jgi:hypothetical protein
MAVMMRYRCVTVGSAAAAAANDDVALSAFCSCTLRSETYSGSYWKVVLFQYF